MKDYKTNWTKEEFKAYLLIYCANADFDESKEEKTFIKSHTTIENFDDIQREFDGDSDFTSIQKIQWSLNNHGYTESEIDVLLQDIKDLFVSDHQYTLLERNIYTVLKRLFKS